MAAYTDPFFAIKHILRELGGTAITANHGIAGTEKGFLFDSRRELFTFDDEQSTHWLRFNYGGAIAKNRLVIFNGHNLDGATLTLKGADSADMTSNPITLLNAVSVSGDGVIDEPFTSDIRPYGELSFGGTGTWELPEVWLTLSVHPTRGPKWPWEDSPAYNVRDFVKPSGDIATLELGPAQRVFQISWEYLHLLLDLNMFDDLFADAGRALPFLFWPPYESTTPLCVKLRRDPDRKPWGRGSGGTDEARDIELELIELIA